MICNGRVVMSASSPSPGAVPRSRLDGVAELRKAFQVILCWVDKCLGQSLRRVCVVKWWWRQASAVCGKSWLSDGRVSGEWALCGKGKVQQVKSAATERATDRLVVHRFPLTYFVG